MTKVRSNRDSRHRVARLQEIRDDLITELQLRLILRGSKNAQRCPESAREEKIRHRSRPQILRSDMLDAGLVNVANAQGGPEPRLKDITRGNDTKDWGRC